MKRIDKMPEVPEIKTCVKHGDYEVKYQALINKIYVYDHCMTCASEKSEKERVERLEKEKKQNEEREKSRRERVRVTAGISKRNIYKTFDDYICSTEGQHKAKNDVIKFKESFPCDKSLLFIGGVGTGKTLLVSALLDSLVDKYKCDISKVIDIIRHLKGTWKKDSEQSEEEILDYYIKLDLLVLDEVGSQFGSDTEKLFIFDIIDGRYQDMKPTIDGVKKVIGERCIDRLREGGGSMIAFDWESSRK